jgi:hypothetical protein
MLSIAFLMLCCLQGTLGSTEADVHWQYFGENGNESDNDLIGLGP